MKWRTSSGSRDLREARRAGTAELGRAARAGQAVVAARGPPAARLDSLEDQLHDATSASTSARRSISAGVRFSVTATSRHVVQPRVVAPERVAGMDAERSRGPDHVARVPSDAGRQTP